MPKVLVAGTTWRWNVTYPDTPPSEGYAVTFYFHHLFAQKKHSKAATANGETYEFRETAANTTSLTRGRYRWEAWAVKGVETFQVASGFVQVRPEIAAAAAGTLQSHAEKMLRAVEAELERRSGATEAAATGGAFLDSYGVAGRQFQKMNTRELMNLRAHYGAIVQQERFPHRLGRKLEVTFG